MKRFGSDEGIYEYSESCMLEDLLKNNKLRYIDIHTYKYQNI